ncbi:MAG: hypothetical protein U1F43_38565 [Myxococcota bacterium]
MGFRTSLVVLALAVAGCGGKKLEEVVQDRDAWIAELGSATGRALTMGDLEVLRPLLPSGRDCGITRAEDAYRLGKWVCAVTKLEDGFTKPFFEAVKALDHRSLIGIKPTAHIGPDPDADPKAAEWQRRLELDFALPEQRIGVFWTIADFDGRYLLIGPPVVGLPTM